MGATVIIWLEADHELEGKKAKVKHVFDIYSQIINETIALSSNRSDAATVESRMRPLLASLSKAHEYDDRFTDTNQLWTGEQDGMTTRWTFAAATLYALTVITSTGYDHVTPATDPGRIFTVFFGLIGIPLMFITAADIRKFLSEIVIRTYANFLVIGKMIANLVEMGAQKSKQRNANILYDKECEDETERDNFIKGFNTIRFTDPDISAIDPKLRVRRDLARPELETLCASREFVYDENLKAKETKYIMVDISYKLNAKPRPFTLFAFPVTRLTLA
ncbi:hypothetical protein L3Y34_012435 [Caenorhabditis briggsae]|uniref:Potassium channel domain-containing protein n=2 Tax=Caenorhabditis briggsae TaxID=6238 RepID=A0AAE8ZP73_CAEBR|nr:hypothetical protein L3Y34_012435 [Caenorhabditis briggsae]